MSKARVRAAVAVAVVLVVVWTVSVASAWAHAGADGGITGRVYIGPLNPIRHTLPGLDGDEAAYSATLVVSDAAGEHEVARVRSNDHGDFRLVLPPGLYLLRPLQEQDPFPRAKAQLVEVRERAFTDTIVLYDLHTP